MEHYINLENKAVKFAPRITNLFLQLHTAEKRQETHPFDNPSLKNEFAAKERADISKTALKHYSQDCLSKSLVRSSSPVSMRSTLDFSSTESQRGSILHPQDHEAPQNLPEKENPQVISTPEYRYTGEVTHSFRHGFGICLYTNGDIYKGFWFQDKRQGFGILDMKSKGKIYKGEFKDDSPCGYIQYKFKEIECEGYFQNYKMADGICLFKKGDYLFEGDLKFIVNRASKPSHIGFGTLRNVAQGSCYEGNHTNFVKLGWGISSSKFNRIVYKGQHKGNHFHGYGELVLSNEIYLGIFKMSKKSGLFIHNQISVERTISLGKFLDNNKNGIFVRSKENAVWIEIWHHGIFVKKTDDNAKYIKNYVSEFYPEESWILSSDYAQVKKISCMCEEK